MLFSRPIAHILLALLLSMSVSAARRGQVATIVITVTSSQVAALHVEVLDHDGVTPVSTTIDDGVCLAHGCNAAGTHATMIETVQLDSTAAYTLTAYLSASDGSAMTMPIVIPARSAFLVYIPVYTP